MFLKMMSNENIADSDSRKSFHMLDGVESVTFTRDGRKAVATVLFETSPDTERFDLSGNCYLMNKRGKTVASFGIHPPVRAA